MATSGEEIINSSTTPDSETKELFCSPCQSDGKRLAAVGYCETCKASLCDMCFKCHTVPIPMRKHRLFKREQPMDEHEVIKDNNQCPEHEGEAIAYHCHSHSFLGCHTCFFQHQKTCREVKYIPEISETITSSDEFKEFMAKLNYTTKTSKDLVDGCKRNITLVEKCHTNALAAIKAFKLELLEAIDQLEKELYEKIEVIKLKSLSRWNSAVDKQQHLETEVKDMAREMEVLQNKNRNNDLYIAMVKSKNKLLSLETELNAAKGGNVVKPFMFQANTELREALKSTSGFGKLHITAEVVKAEHAKDINLTLPNDKRSCTISGSAIIPNHKLIIADYRSYNVKIIDTKQQKVLSAMTLPSAPWSLAKVTDNTVAATLPTDKKIVFVKTDPTLSIDKEIEVDGACYGVAYNDGKLVVGFYSPKVEIMDLKGSVLRTIQTDDNGQALFNFPYYVAINPECSLIYVSNHWSHNVVCLRFDGTVVATYKDDNELKYPLQVIVDSTGKVYVCGYESHNVHQITENCKKIKVLMTSADGLNRPYTISYEETEGKLYVGQGNTDNLKVFRMIYDSS